MNFKTAIINVYKDLKEKHEHNEERNGRYKKEPNGNPRVEKYYIQNEKFTRCT